MQKCKKSKERQKMNRKIASFDEFAYACPYFTSETDVNNGYGCTHPKQEETDPDENKKEHGKCYCWSCPLGIEAEAEDADNEDIDLCGITKEELAEAEGNSEYILVNVGPDATEDENEAWDNYERYINRYNPDWRKR